MNRLAMGALLGGVAVYLYDPELGEQRRQRLFSLWRENRESAVHVGRSASQAAARLTALVGGAVIGGVLVYFLDSSKGSEGRQWLLAALQEKQHSTLGVGRQAVQQTAKTVKPVADRLGEQVADAVAGVKSKIRAAAGTVTAAAAAADTGVQSTG